MESQSASLTNEQLKQKLLDIIDKYPYNTNPRDPVTRSCLYTDVEDPNRHCLIGQLLVEMGLDAPACTVKQDIRNLAYSEKYRGIFSTAQVSFLTSVQSMVDRTRLTTWSTVRLYVISKFN